MKADDVEGALKKVLSPGYTTNLDTFVSKLEKDALFKPYGELVHAFTVKSCKSQPMSDNVTQEDYNFL